MRDDQRFEFKIAEKTGGIRHAMSGAREGNADASTLVFGFECKSPVVDRKSFRMTKKIWDKAEQQCKLNGLLTTVAIQLDGLTLIGLEWSQLQAICSQSIPEMLLQLNFFKEKACHELFGTIKDTFLIEQIKYEEYQGIADMSNRTAAWVVELGKINPVKITFVDLDTFIQISDAANMSA